MAVEVYLPKMSDHMERGTIISWLVKEGNAVEKGQVILELETDKATGELEASASGILKGVRASDGMEVLVGEVIAYIARPDEEIPSMPLIGEKNAGPDSAQQAIARPEISIRRAAPVAATPVARRVAKELGVELSMVKGTGPEGRIKEEDVRAYATEQQKQLALSKRRSEETARPVELADELLSASSKDDRIPFEVPAETLELTSIQVRTSQRMSESIRTAPHIFLQLSANMTRAQDLQVALQESIRVETGEKLSITTILVWVVAAVLKRHPRVNASYENGHLKLYKQINVGVAVGTPNGLVVPVIRDADQKNLAQITKELKYYQAKAEQLRFSPRELSGGTFTISNLGMYGIDVFNAIIYPPQSAILAIGRIAKIPVGMPDDTIALQPIMAMTLSADHRVLDGIQAARFLTDVKNYIEQPYHLI